MAPKQSQKKAAKLQILKDPAPKDVPWKVVAADGEKLTGVSRKIFKKFENKSFDERISAYKKIFEEGTFSAEEMSKVLDVVFSPDEKRGLWGKLQTVLARADDQTKKFWDSINTKSQREGKEAAKNMVLAVQVPTKISMPPWAPPNKHVFIYSNDAWECLNYSFGKPLLMSTAAISVVDWPFSHTLPMGQYRCMSNPRPMDQRNVLCRAHLNNLV